MASCNFISHICETRNFVMAILHWKQGLLYDKCTSDQTLQTVHPHLGYTEFYSLIDERVLEFFLNDLFNINSNVYPQLDYYV